MRVTRVAADLGVADSAEAKAFNAGRRRQRSFG